MSARLTSASCPSMAMVSVLRGCGSWRGPPRCDPRSCATARPRGPRGASRRASPHPCGDPGGACRSRSKGRPHAPLPAPTAAAPLAPSLTARLRPPPGSRSGRPRPPGSESAGAVSAPRSSTRPPWNRDRRRSSIPSRRRRRSVGGQEDAGALPLQGLEEMEELLLGTFGRAEILDLVQEEEVEAEPALPPGAGDACREGCDELLAELGTGEEPDGRVRMLRGGRHGRRPRGIPGSGSDRRRGGRGGCTPGRTDVHGSFGRPSGQRGNLGPGPRPAPGPGDGRKGAGPLHGERQQTLRLVQEVRVAQDQVGIGGPGGRKLLEFAPDLAESVHVPPEPEQDLLPVRGAVPPDLSRGVGSAPPSTPPTPRP
jgi:hypothetical protein